MRNEPGLGSLQDLLRDLFSGPDQLAQFVKELPHGRAIVQDLPDAKYVEFSAYCPKIVETLDSRSELDQSFFERLLARYPRRDRDIRAVRQQIERTSIGDRLANDFKSVFAHNQLSHLQAILGVKEHEMLDHCAKATPEQTVRDVFQAQWPTREQLADWTADQVRARGFVADGAALLDLHVDAFAFGLKNATQARLRQLFPDKFAAPPRPPAQPPRASIGPSAPTVVATRPSHDHMDFLSITARIAISANLAPSIAFVLRQPLKQVERRLVEAHGKHLVRNLFSEQWPDAPTLGRYTIAEVCKYRLQGTLAAITGLSYEYVVRGIAMVEGHPEADRIRVQDVLHADWRGMSPTDSSGGGASDLDMEMLTVMGVHRHPTKDELLELIRSITGLRRTAIMKALADYPQETRLRDIFHERWPTWDDWMSLTAASVLRHGLIVTIARRLELDPHDVLVRLQAVHGNCQVGKLFNFASKDSTESGSLGELTLAEVDRRDLRPTLTQFLTARGIMQKKGVSQRFNNNHGSSLVRNVWPRIPPEDWPLV